MPKVEEQEQQSIQGEAAGGRQSAEAVYVAKEEVPNPDGTTPMTPAGPDAVTLPAVPDTWDKASKGTKRKDLEGASAKEHDTDSEAEVVSYSAAYQQR